MRYINVFLASLCLICSCSFQNKDCNKNMVVPKMPEILNKALYERDKQLIIECYISNVEYYRVNPHKYEHSVIFEPYSCYYANDSLGYVKLPSSSNKNVQVNVGYILYNHSKLISIVFLGVKQTIKQKNIEEPSYGTEHDALCLVGLRKDTLSTFTLYPLRVFKQVGYPNYDKPLSVIIGKYFNCLAKTEDMWGKKYRTNVGDINFWNNNLLFDKVKTESGETLYYFQTYSLSDLDGKHWNNHHKYDVVQCR